MASSSVRPPPAALDLTNVAGEVARRAQARELGAGVVTALFRLVKLSTLHALDNQAIVRQIDDTVAIIGEYGRRADHNVSILFAHGSVLVGGQLLRANRGVYEGALELGDLLQKVGAAEIGVQRDVKAQDLYAFVSAMGEALRNPKPPNVERPSPRIRLRALSAAALGREIAVERADAREDPRAAVARTYASAIVIMRRFHEAIRKGRYELPQRVKRVAQRLVDLSVGETPAFLGVTAVRNQNHDEAGRAVNTAILALAMTRQIDDDPVMLLRVAMAALLYDCARPRQAGIVGSDAAIVPQLSDAQDAEMPAASAVVLTAIGRVNEPSVVRTVMTYEAHWVKREKRLGPLYRGLRLATLQARILATARAFNDRLTPAAGQTALGADEAVAEIERETTDPADRTVLRLLVGAIGLFPTGTLVELSTGEVAIVVQTPLSPAQYSQPRVRIVLDATGGTLQRPVEIDLAQRLRPGEPGRSIRRVVATSDDPSAAALRQLAAAPAERSALGASGSGIRGGAASGVKSAPPPSTPWTPEPSSSGRGSIVPTLASQFTREQPQGQGVKIQEVESLDSELLEDDGPVDSATRSMSKEDRFRLLGSIEDEETSPSDRARARSTKRPEPIDARATVRPQDADPRATPTHRPQQASAADAGSEALGDGIPSSAKKPTAEGTLGKTPLVHLLVYMLDQRLGGTTVFETIDGTKHAVLFAEGAPAKVRTGTQVAPLDRMILEQDLLDEATLQGTLIEISKRRILHGRYLVSQGLLDRETVVELLRLQLVRKMAYLFELAPTTRYAYYANDDLLASYGGPELLPCEPLAVIMSGIRLRASDPVVDATLARVSGRPISLHRDAELARFELQRDERAVIDLLRARKTTLEELYVSGVGQERIIKMVVYALAITRSLDLGVGGGRPPVGIARLSPEPAPVATMPPAPKVGTGFGMGFGRPVGKADSKGDPTPASRSAPEAENAHTRQTTKRPRSDPPETPDAGPASAGRGAVRLDAPDPGSARTPVSGMPPSAPRATSVTARPVPQALGSAPTIPPASVRTAPLTASPPSPRRGVVAANPAKVASGARRAEIMARASTIEGETFFQRLGVSLDANEALVQSSYFALAKAWHPDRLPPDLQDLRSLVSKVFTKLSEAFQVLNDAKKREDYKRLLGQGGGKPDEDEKIAQVVDAAMSFQKAEILLKKNDLAGAESLTAIAVKGDPDQPEYLAMHAWIQALRRGDPPPFIEGTTSKHFDDLIRTLDVVLMKEPRFERALFYRGSLFKRTGRNERAIRDFRLAAEVNPKNIDAVREVRLYEMRKRGGGPAPKGDKPQPPEGGAGGLLGKFFKR